MSYKAVHLAGGNFFDDVRLDLRASYATQSEWLLEVEKVSVRGSNLSTALRRSICRREPYRLREALVNTGLRRQWFEEFRQYWEDVLDGRPLTVLDFHNLRFDYRRRHQNVEQMAWPDQEHHIANWQSPPNLYQTFDSVYRTALHPMWHGRLLRKHLRHGFRVLEYACGVAPMYRTWRTFLNATSSRWMLADIAKLPLPLRAAHAGQRRRGGAVIDDFCEPLRSDAGGFDLIFVQTVFEHLDRPQHIAEYPVDRLKPGGLLWFDYIRSAGMGLDTPSSLSQRRATLEFLGEHLAIIHGELRIDDASLGTCIGRKVD